MLLGEEQVTKSSPQELLVKWWQEHAPELYIYLLSRVKDEELAWELYQDTFVKAYSHLKRKPTKFESEEKLRRWLIKVMRSVITDHFRKERFKKLFLVGDLLELLGGRRGHAQPPDVVIANREKLHHLALAMKELRELEREVITLKLVMGFKFREISELLGKPIGTCITAYNRGIKKLEKMLQEGGER